MRMKAVIAACLLAVAAPALAAAPDTAVPPAAAPAKPDLTKAARLDWLFAALKAAPTEADAKQIESRIWSEWLASGDRNIDVLMAEALTAMEHRLFTAALYYLTTIVEAKPDYIEGWNKRATVYFMIDDYKHSIEDIARTLALEPRHFGALAGLGMIMINTGNKASALKAFERAYAVDPYLANGKQVIETLKAALGRDI